MTFDPDSLDKVEDRTYHVFKRSAKSFEEYARAEKETVATDVNLQRAIDMCSMFNRLRSDEEKEAGTKMEFERE